MAKVICTELQKDGASGPNITLDTSKNVTCENNLTVDGTSTLSGNVAVTGNVTVTGTLPADKLTGALPAISGASLTGIATRTTPFKNLIINGNHQISQRHTTKSNVTGEYLTDRWAGHGDAMTFDQVAITYGSTGPWTEGHRYSLRVKNEAAGSDASATGQYILYYIESQDLATSGWDYSHTSGGNNNVALSFWVKTSVAGTYYGSLWTHDGTAKAYNFSLGALSANTWAKVTKIIPGHSQLTFNNDNGQGLRLNLYTHRSSNTTASDAVMDSWHNIDYNKTAPDVTHAFNTTVNATYEFTGVQLEVGDAVTDYEHRSYTEELIRCQRYCWMLENNTTIESSNFGSIFVKTSTEARWFPQFPVEMRADPTLTFTGVVRTYDGSQVNTITAGSTGTVTSSNGRSRHGAQVNLKDGSGSALTVGRSGQVYGNGTDAAKFVFSAEL